VSRLAEQVKRGEVKVCLYVQVTPTTAVYWSVKSKRARRSRGVE
jgi:hypothetical protein